MKRFSKIMAFLMMCVMLMGLGTITTFAATTYTPIGGTTTITKNLVVEDDANIPDVTFNYTITRGTPVAATASTIEILASEKGGSIGDAAFSNADTASAIAGLPSDADPTAPTAGKKYAQKSVQVTFPNDSFTKPGVYRYVINEADGAKPGITYDATARYLDVFVVADPSTNALAVQSYVLRNSATTIGTDGQYTSEPGVKSSGYTNTVTQYDFDFSKTITGNQGDKNKRFTFTLSVTNAIPGTYPIEATDVTGNPTTITIGTDGTFSATYDLTNQSSFKILNLNKDAVCTVSEDAQDYTPSHKVDGGAVVGTNNSGAITLANSDHSVAFTNTREGIIPTGVLLTIAPFTVGIFLFGAIIVFVMAKRRREVY
jgi:pilin isopeptide linkage protein